MQTRKVWVLSNNDTAAHPVAWIDRTTPVYSRAIKGPFVPMRATITNNGKVMAFEDDSESDDDAGYNTKGIVLESLAYIKGMKTIRTVTGGTSPVITKKKQPHSYIFLKEPTWSTMGPTTTETAASTALTVTISEDNINALVPIAGSCYDSTSYMDVPGSIMLKFTNSSGTLLGFANFTQGWSSPVSDSQFYGQFYGVEGTVSKTVSTDNLGTATCTFAFTTSFPIGTKVSIGVGYIKSISNYYFKETEAAQYFPIESFTVSSSSNLHWYSTPYKVSGLKNITSITLRGTVSSGIASQPSIDPNELYTYNTPSWSFLSDIKRVMRGGRPVMAGSLRYLDYMNSLQPTGDTYRDYEPYEIGI